MSTKTELVSASRSSEHIHAGQPEIVLTLDESQADAQHASFERDGYTVARGVFDQTSLKIYTTYALMSQANNYFGTREGRQGFYDRYADLLMESILLHLQPAMEQATGLSLLPTYSYLRIYETGAVLAKHTDRHACEISASLTIGYDAPEPWPLRLESNGQPRAITLRPGDMLLYKGREIPHWREQFDGRYWIQAFFHYVDAAGELASYKFDGRAGVGALPK
ncbi:MAG TPA: hypothetical protein VGO96_21780 [Pyrinomonadaceae bacterium]|jgi:hypothetical protein|nr:hypothetical protein [Pyrinomonadaceae bacterium]